MKTDLLQHEVWRVLGRMNQDQFLLKWNNHQNNFVEVFSYLRTQDAFVDVTLACDGKSFSAHRVVLSACSPYFQTLFQTNPCKHPIVFLKDVKGQELEALIEFIYKGEVSVSQSELASLISTAENLKIKGLAEPDRPVDKSVKRIASPPRPQPPPLPQQSTPATPVGVPQHLQVSKYPQSSPVAKRKKSEQFNVQSSYVGVRENQEEVVTVEAGNGENLSLRGENLSLRGENLSIRDHPAPQVVLVPSHEPPHQPDITSHTPQPYASHHGPIAASEGVLYSVSGTAIYAGTAQVSSSSRGEQITREVYPQADQYHSSDEGTLPGPSGVQTQPHAETSMTIKLEPSSAGVTAETWEGSNQSYEDGGGGMGGSGSGPGVVPTGGDPLTMQLPLHTEMTESSQLHDSSRGIAALRRLGRPHPCPFCTKVFPFKSILRNHLRIHTGEKPYACRVCGRTFNHCSNYYKHERSCALKLAECAEDQAGVTSMPFGGGELWGDAGSGNTPDSLQQSNTSNTQPQAHSLSQQSHQPHSLSSQLSSHTLISQPQSMSLSSQQQTLPHTSQSQTLPLSTQQPTLSRTLPSQSHPGDHQAHAIPPHT
ncbi:protein bric-a-brac 1-like isoform X2 [Homarus americanus]|uniref:protein bric-a-brac 1-like isoform X2 n=1 Tax=Homarus americanus TaxID=6706 RepID=UPI001C488398|nr:protein bric-a-brac 1-like isoform X2 [Homarus americanus]